LTRFIVTGGAGFIGSKIVQRLLDDGHVVRIVDKISKKDAKRIQTLLNNRNLSYLQVDLSRTKQFDCKGFQTVIHFAAPADASMGYKNTDLDLKHGTISTYNVLESMRLHGIKKIIFSSSSTVYGYQNKIPIREDHGMLFPASLYGASKLSSEAIISAYCYLYGIKSWIFRFGNVLGPDVRRGVIFDLANKLRKNEHELKVLGNGKQIKDYIHVDDLVEAILHAYQKSDEKINVFNLGSGILSVKEIVKIILDEMKLKKTKVTYSGGPKGWHGGGWPGDINLVYYDTSKIKRIGWKPKHSPEKAVRLAVRGIRSSR